MSILKAQTLYQEISHELGGRMSRKLRRQDVVNNAIDHVTYMHPWDWLQGGYAYLDTRLDTAVATATWTEATLTLTQSNAFTSYVFVPGDFLQVTAGTDAITGYTEVASRVDDSNVTLKTSISSLDPGADMPTGDIVGSIDGSSVALPADLKALLEAKFMWENHSSTIILTSPSRVARRRSSQPPYEDGTFLGAVHMIQGDPPQYTLQVAPSFGSHSTKLLQILYERYIPHVTSDDSEILAPVWMHRLLKEACRAIAAGLEKPHEGNVDQRLEMLERGATYRTATKADDGAQEDQGRITGGHAPRGPRNLLLPLGEITIGGPTPAP